MLDLAQLRTRTLPSSETKTQGCVCKGSCSRFFFFFISAPVMLISNITARPWSSSLGQNISLL